MTETEILDYYNDNWNDYNKVVDMLHIVIDNFNDDIAMLKMELVNKNSSNDCDKKIVALKEQLQECQDNLDEERHKI